MALLALLLGAAFGAPLVPVIHPSAEPADVREQYAAHAATLGRSGEAAALVCRDLAEALVLCFTYLEGATRRYVSQAELRAWELDLDRLEAHARAGARSALGPARPAPASVPDMEGRYWVSAQSDGLDAAGLVWPEKLQELLGAPPVVAVPDRGTLLAWIPGNRALDTVMAVGARKMYEAATTPVSPLVYRWDGAAWQVWAEVRRTPPSAELPSPPP